MEQFIVEFITSFRGNDADGGNGTRVSEYACWGSKKWGNFVCFLFQPNECKLRLVLGHAFPDEERRAIKLCELIFIADINQISGGLLGGNQH